MRYILDKEELEELKTKILSSVSDFIKNVDKFKEKTHGWDNSHTPSKSINNFEVTINIGKFKELTEKLREDVSETIRDL